MVRVQTNKAGANSHPVPLFAYETIHVCTPQRYAKRRKTKKITFFAKKIIKSYCTIKNNAYICIVVDDETTTDAAGSANQNETEMTTLKYTTRTINREFKIKVSGVFEGKKINTLVGVSGLIRLVADIELTNRLLDRAFESTDDKVICRLRRGLRIGFYVH